MRALLILIIAFQAIVDRCGLNATEPPRADGQLPIALVERMPRLPVPLAVREWPTLARAYYERVLDPAATGDGMPCVELPPAGPGFRMKSYLGNESSDEAMTCLAAVIGARIAGLDPRQVHGVDWVARGKAWFDPALGFYRDRPAERSQVVSADIYGYWPAIQGTTLAALYPDDAELAAQAATAVRAFQRLAHGMGCPDAPDFDVLGWDFAALRPGGRSEPMNRLGNAPSVAWMLVVGAALTGDPDMVACARAALRWYIAHPGRYELAHVMGPLAAARLNALGGEELDLAAVLAAWFGDGDPARHPWRVTAGARGDHGETCDGLDGARWGDDGFYAFTMGSLQGPAWLVPVARYDQRWAKAIARYALHLANSARLLQGEGLDDQHQDHAAWKRTWDPGNLFFYEGMKSWDPSPEHRLRPYATGDVVQLGWTRGHAPIPPHEYLAQRAAWFGATALNISLYMGNHVGFLGGIVATTNVPGILRWDCLATDWFHQHAYPTHLYWNPYLDDRLVTVVPAGPCDLYDAVAGRVVATGVTQPVTISFAADQAMVLVQVPSGVPGVRVGTEVRVDGTAVDFRAGESRPWTVQP